MTLLAEARVRGIRITRTESQPALRQMVATNRIWLTLLPRVFLLDSAPPQHPTTRR